MDPTRSLARLGRQAIALALLLLLGGAAHADRWEVVARDGFGDPDNTSVLSLQTFDGFVYAGTKNLAGAQVWKAPVGDDTSWRNVSPGWSSENVQAQSMAVFRDKLYVATTYDVWQSSGEFTWPYYQCQPSGWFRVRCEWIYTKVELWRESFRHTSSPADGYPSLEVFGDYLYLAMTGGDRSSGQALEIWRTPDGRDWERVVDDAFGDRENNYNAQLFQIGDDLYAATGRQRQADAGRGTGLEIWRTRNGTSWVPVVADGVPGIPGRGFGDTGNTTAKSMAWFNDRPYVGTVNHYGPQIWRQNGHVWELVYGDPGYSTGGRGIQSMATLGSRIFWGERLTPSGAGVTASRTGNPGSWFGVSDGIEPENTGIEVLARHSLYDLYAGTTNQTSGGQVLRKITTYEDLRVPRCERRYEWVCDLSGCRLQVVCR